MPFDRQVLRIKFVAEMGMEMFRMQFAPLDRKAAFSTFCPEGWRVSRLHRVDGRLESVDADATLRVARPNEKTNNFARFDIFVHLEREPGFYFWRVMFVLLIITFASITAFNIEAKDVGTRASVLLTLLLTAVGYEQVVAAWVPAKPYLTILDRYILSSFLIQSIAILESIIVVWYFCRPLDDMCLEDDELRFCGPIDDTYENGFSKASGGPWTDKLRFEHGFEHRTPPNYACDNRLVDFEEMFVRCLYGYWAAWHLVFAVMPRLAIRLSPVQLAILFGFFINLLDRCVQTLLNLPGRCMQTCFRCTSCADMGCRRKSWDSVYKENNVSEEKWVLEPTISKHPYDDAPLLYYYDEAPLMQPSWSAGTEATHVLESHIADVDDAPTSKRPFDEVPLLHPDEEAASSIQPSSSIGTKRAHAFDSQISDEDHKTHGSDSRPPQITIAEVLSESIGGWAAGEEVD